MAKLKDNKLMQVMSGTLNTIVLKQYSYGTLISKRPDRCKVKLSPTQTKSETKIQRGGGVCKIGLER
jgi:hypothetical protein